MEDCSVKVAGFNPLSTRDFPNKKAAIVFCQGCSAQFTCLENSSGIPSEKIDNYEWLTILRFLYSQRKKIEAVVFSGGEPTLQHNLPKAMQQLKKMGFLVGLHTAGIFPERLKKCLPYVDWICLEIKANVVERLEEDPSKILNSFTKPLASIKLILNSGISYQVQTCLPYSVTSQKEISSIKNALASLGISRNKLHIRKLHPELRLCSLQK